MSDGLTAKIQPLLNPDLSPDEFMEELRKLKQVMTSEEEAEFIALVRTAKK